MSGNVGKRWGLAAVGTVVAVYLAFWVMRFITSVLFDIALVGVVAGLGYVALRSDFARRLGFGSGSSGKRIG